MKSKIIVVTVAFVLSPLAYGFPSEQKLKEVKPLVDSLIADDMQAMKAKKKSQKDVAVALVAFADKAESEAGKFLLLHKAFCVSARGNIDDYAAHVLNRIRNEIADVSAEYIVDLVSKEIRNISAVKSPKVFAIYSEAKRTVDLRRRLATIVSRLRKEPDDKALLRQQAEILAALGNWTRALEIYANIGSKAARYELDPQSVEGYDLLNAADFWWNYKANDDEPFKAHAAALYRVALDKDVATGLRREMALKRIKEAASLGLCSSRTRQFVGKVPEKRPLDKMRYMVVDLTKTGLKAVSYLDDIPIGGWGDEYRTMKIVLRKIDPGSFEYLPGKSYKITKPFYIGIFEITQKQYEMIMMTNPSKYKGDFRPVEQVSYLDIRGNNKGLNWPKDNKVDDYSYLGKLRHRYGIAFDLPTEVQWEYACRAGTTGDFNVEGVEMTKLGKCKDNGGLKDQHAKVGSFLPNAWGLYDMHGNVWEWCVDRAWDGERERPWTIDANESEVDPKGPTVGASRIRRGGSWDVAEYRCRTSRRNREDADARWLSIGFRLACPAGLAQ